MGVHLSEQHNNSQHTQTRKDKGIRSESTSVLFSTLATLELSSRMRATFRDSASVSRASWFWFISWMSMRLWSRIRCTRLNLSNSGHSRESRLGPWEYRLCSIGCFSLGRYIASCDSFLVATAIVTAAVTICGLSVHTNRILHSSFWYTMHDSVEDIGVKLEARCENFVTPDLNKTWWVCDPYVHASL